MKCKAMPQNHYKITFGMELDASIRERLTKEFGIPTPEGIEYVDASSPNQAMHKFCKKYEIKYKPVRTRNLLKFVYVVRNEDNSVVRKYCLRGLKWNQDFNYLTSSSSKADCEYPI